MRQAKSIRVVIADDHPAVCEGMSAIINRIPGMSVVAVVPNWSEVVPTIESRRPDLALLDVHMPGMEAADGVAAIRGISQAVRIVLISAFELEEDVYGVIRAGANGFLVKTCLPREMETCFRAVLEGKVWLHPRAAAKLAARMQAPTLTRREAGVLDLMAAGKSNKEVGVAMNITEGTVKIHVNHILYKLGAESRTAAVSKAFQRGLIRLSRIA
jgi:DNA-binding NarL/FixJ family response regulator